MGDCGEAVISVDDYHKAYGETVAVAGLSFGVHAGEVLGLVGPNGAGKTTTLRALCGIITPTRGRMRIAGFDLAEQDVEAKRRLAYVPDDPRLFDALTVAEHLQFTAAAYGVTEYDGKAERLLAQFELTEKRDTLARELSRGMRQKVAICCAYLHDPPAILLDEPFTGLDPHAIRALKQSIRDASGNGAAVIVSSHLLGLVEDLCSHLIILARGRRRYFGPMADVRKAFTDSEDESLEEIFFRATTDDETLRDGEE